MANIHETLQASAKSSRLHLRELLKDESRCGMLQKEFDGVHIDFSRQLIKSDELTSMIELAKTMNVEEKIKKMYDGVKINETEGRAVLHTATRAFREDKFVTDGKDIVPDVYEVLDRIDAFAEKVRSGEWKGCTGKTLTNILVVGIGGSALGTEFVYEAIRTHPDATKASEGLTLKILANVDPIDFKRALGEYDAEKTLCIICSKTFTTAETMMNATAVRDWLQKELKQECQLSHHLAATSTNLKLTKEFGIIDDNVFGFWEWVGGRFSVCSAVGQLPLTIMFGAKIMKEFRDGARAMDQHFKNTPLENNLPVLMGLIGYFNAVYMNMNTCAVLPYCQALHRFPAHIQQMAMESNGKGCTMNGKRIAKPTGEIFFGEPGTNGQHSFYQLMHQGSVVPADFIGFVESQNPVTVTRNGKTESLHDELMCNFFSQPDALAIGRFSEEMPNLPESDRPPRTFPGNRPSTMILMPVCNAYYVGSLLALYEHRVTTQGFLWDLNSFDQFGVELGKVLAGNVRNLLKCDNKEEELKSFCKSSQKMINSYMSLKK